MRRILRENLWMMMVIGAFLVIVAIAKVGWGQGQPPPLTLEQRIEKLEETVNAYERLWHQARIGTLNVEGELKKLQKTYDLLLKQAQKLTAEKVGLMGKLKAANAKITIKPKEVKDEKAPDTGAVD